MMILLKRTYFLLILQIVALTCSTIHAQAADREVTYLQTDRTTYIAGETVFYKLDVLDAVTRKHSMLSKIGYILIRPVNLNPVLKVRVKIDEGTSNGSITLPDTLLSGIYQIVAFTNVMKNSGEQYFFHKEIVIANRFDKDLNLQLINSDSTNNNGSQLPLVIPEIMTDKATYGLREKVKVSLGKTNSKANVAVSVYEESNMLPADKSIVETLNEWAATPVGKQSSSTYLPENSGKILRGRVIDATTHKSVQTATVLVSCTDTVPNLQYATTNSDGIFQMLLGDYYNGKELFFTIVDMPADQQWKIQIEDEFALSKKWNPSNISDNTDSKEFITKSKNIVYINKSYKLNDEATEELVPDKKPICPRLYYCPVRTVLPSDFVPLNDFPEIAVEILPMIRVTKHNGEYKIEVINASTYLINDRGPAIFLDGVFVDDINKIMGLGSDKIKKIDVLGAERIFGDLVFQGVVSIISKSNEIVNTTPAAHSLRLKNDDFNFGRSFVAVNPNSIQNKNTPFFKQLLYWNPNLTLNGTDNTNFEFYTSDNVATFIIKAEGITEDGTPISTTSRIQVNHQLNASTK